MSASFGCVVQFMYLRVPPPPCVVRKYSVTCPLFGCSFARIAPDMVDQSICLASDQNYDAAFCAGPFLQISASVCVGADRVFLVGASKNRPGRGMMSAHQP